MSPIINFDGQRICYACGRQMFAWVSVNISNVHNAEICPDCMYKLADIIYKKEEEFSNNGKDGECHPRLPSDA